MPTSAYTYDVAARSVWSRSIKREEDRLRERWATEALSRAGAIITFPVVTSQVSETDFHATSGATLCSAAAAPADLYIYILAVVDRAVLFVDILLYIFFYYHQKILCNTFFFFKSRPNDEALTQITRIIDANSKLICTSHRETDKEKLPHDYCCGLVYIKTSISLQLFFLRAPRISHNQTRIIRY